MVRVSVSMLCCRWTEGNDFAVVVQNVSSFVFGEDDPYIGANFYKLALTWKAITLLYDH